ncbi:metalloregulator ArsR/SmtB family transcription factor [Actinoallomurus sp. NBC_01490]|uniref:ArsR/SmtB family transcription factor n=1 Tax=Actinoallomurus sp. NBC_01490 TaxID=2903557 RepID=UPI002E342BA7|nr:metalloregulator ArsR/SmtB family transcription factor [Actinoallomurus sp. NBC_01490]
MDDDLVFKALADPTRRLLLDRLFERDGRTLTELESQLDMTRFGVMKHLRVLEEAGLVVSRKTGRSRTHYLNPVPVRRIHDRWIGKYTERRAAALSELKTRLEETVTSTTDTLTTQVYQVFIKATPERIWEAITNPEFTAEYFHGARITMTNGRYVAHGPNGELWGDDEVIEWDPPRRLVHGWRSLYDEEMAKEETSRVTWEIEPQDDGTCLLTAVHDRLEGAPKTARSVSGPGWMRVLSGLKTLLETGESLAG